MRWTRIGKIFDPTQHALLGGCREYAQSPQALVFADFVRIYFSTRSRDGENYLSHVAFADVAMDFRRILKVSDHVVLNLGELGCFDEHGIFPISPVRVGRQVFAYTCGWSRRTSVSVETGIGRVVSYDEGLTFRRCGSGPVLSASLKEPCLVGDGFVRVVKGMFHMWYIFGTGWRRYAEGSPPDRTYKIGHAVSVDGINWEKEEGRRIIPDRLEEDESQALPTVVQIRSRYHMFFCYRYSFDFRRNRGRGYRIGHAWSDDLSNWVRDDDFFPGLDSGSGEWDSDMQCYPHVFEMNGEIYLLYNGNEFGRYGFGVARLEQ